MVINPFRISAVAICAEYAFDALSEITIKFRALGNDMLCNQEHPDEYFQISDFELMLQIIFHHSCKIIRKCKYKSQIESLSHESKNAAMHRLYNNMCRLRTFTIIPRCGSAEL